MISLQDIECPGSVKKRVCMILFCMISFFVTFRMGRECDLCHELVTVLKARAGPFYTSVIECVEDRFFSVLGVLSVWRMVGLSVWRMCY